ncbi:hypothetical protein GYMLUDRAFT_243735 [Collybiopsis luxurians FD-317 M1]|uniref:Uncharacterized protein n=1 Tax=Collybiopsis luxurians FD-317 M1 TaxID=944289 RepID=A0A0D0CXS7_9AGAR|nr:hypothetical protein GYMLUDRAFT_243735 [Collybiopsis luxurians FD-317 M1]
MIQNNSRDFSVSGGDQHVITTRSRNADKLGSPTEDEDFPFNDSPIRPRNDGPNPNSISGPSLFAHSRNVKIYGGNFITGDNGHHKRADAFDNIPEVRSHLVKRSVDLTNWNNAKIPRFQLRLLDTVSTRNEWTFSVGEASDRDSNGRKLGKTEVIIQTFEGPRAKEHWQMTVRSAQRLVNPHLLHIIGISPRSVHVDDDPHYILFDGGYRRNTRRLIASGLRQGERETALVGSQIVYGIASGLDYLSKMISNLSLVESFDVFSDDLGKTVLAFTPHNEQMERWRQNNEFHYTPWQEQRDLGDVNPELRKDDTAICNSLISKLFNDANHIIYREKLDRSSIDDLEISYSNEVGGTGRDTSVNERADPEESSTVEPLEDFGHRREITWMPLGSTLPLSDISKTYADILQAIPPPTREARQSSMDFPRRLGQRRSAVVHECKRYRREEITFTPDAFQNAILVFEKPSLNEICSICGQAVVILSSPIQALPSFRDFVTDEKRRLIEKRQALVKSEMDKRMADLVKFSQSFKLNKPIPDDLVPLLTKMRSNGKFAKGHAETSPRSSHVI